MPDTVKRGFSLRTLLLLTLLAAPVAAQVGRNTAVLNPDLASEAQLAAVAGIGADVAKAIMANRPFMSQAAFDAFLGKTLTPEQRTSLWPRIFLPINLNTASPAEILMVPGAGNRMLREFREYRPYKALTVWRREIGKYVDSTEVARLEQYVFVPVELNSATDADILSIPGAGNRMVREFKEYRPWVSKDQFVKEIGKYVGPKEVERLWSYVYIAPKM